MGLQSGLAKFKHCHGARLCRGAKAVALECICVAEYAAAAQPACKTFKMMTTAFKRDERRTTVVHLNSDLAEI